jgi:hypothetical protein
MLCGKHQPGDQQRDAKDTERRDVRQPPPGGEHSRAFLRQNEPGHRRREEQAGHRQRASPDILRAPPYVGQTQGHAAEHGEVASAPPLAPGLASPVPPAPRGTGPGAGRIGWRDCRVISSRKCWRSATGVRQRQRRGQPRRWLCRAGQRLCRAGQRLSQRAWHGQPDGPAGRMPHRWSSGVQVRPRSPTYSLSGRISRLSACCSITCAVQPAIRLTEKTDVNRSVGMRR